VGGDAGVLEGLVPLVDGVGLERGGVPLSLVFGEDLDAVHAEAFGLEEGVVQAAGDGEVGAEHGGECKGVRVRYNEGVC